MASINEDRVRKLAAELYARRNEAVVVPFVERWIANWRPEPQWCHWNVDLWVAGEAGSRAVRGWLLFDYATASRGLLDVVVFQSHSVVEEDGALVDITPSEASQRYPFITHADGDDDFQELTERLGASRIEYRLPQKRSS